MSNFKWRYVKLWFWTIFIFYYMKTFFPILILKIILPIVSAYMIYGHMVKNETYSNSFT